MNHIMISNSLDGLVLPQRTTIHHTQSEVYSFDIQDCTQDMPTQSPTLSPSSPPTLSSLPTSKFTCFDEGEGGENGVLYKAIRAYVSQDCANNEKCEIGQTCGWPMNSWCVRHVKDMSSLFKDMNTFNEDINEWRIPRALLICD